MRRMAASRKRKAQYGFIIICFSMIFSERPPTCERKARLRGCGAARGLALASGTWHVSIATESRRSGEMTAVDFLPFVDHLAQVSGEAIMPFFRAAFSIEDKSGGGVFDPVTEADRAAEAAMRKLIGAAFPHHVVIGEEFGAEGPESEYVCVLDPIDGTKSFIAGLPLWGTLIGLLHLGSPCYGLMHQPFTREKFYGDGKAAHWSGHAPNGEKVKRRLLTRACSRLDHATLMTTSPKLIPEPLRPRYEALEARTRLARYGGDCYAYCMLAAGHVD